MARRGTTLRQVPLSPASEGLDSMRIFRPQGLHPGSSSGTNRPAGSPFYMAPSPSLCFIGPAMNFFKAIRFRIKGWPLISDVFEPGLPGGLKRVHPAIGLCPKIKAMSIASTIPSP